MLASLSAAFRVVDEVVVAMPDVHARFAGVERLITEQAEDGHCVLVGGGVRKDDDQVDVVFPVLRLLVGVLRMDAVRERHLHNVGNPILPTLDHVLGVHDSLPIARLVDSLGHKKTSWCRRQLVSCT